MKTSIHIAFIAILSASSWVFADDGGASKNSNSSVAAMADDNMPMSTEKMQEKMLRMHEQMHKIMRTKDGVERERLIQEHRKMIEENMQMMHGMMSNFDRDSPDKH